MAIKIMLDAGHYGKYNRSPVLKSYYESDMTWALHLELKKELEAYGFEVGTTRANKDIDLTPLSARGEKAKGYDMFISLHSNAVDGAKNEPIDRVEVYYPYDGRNGSKELAKTFAESIAKEMNVSTGKAKTKQSSSYPGYEHYGVMRGAQNVKVPLYFIIEHSFHTNLKATTWLSDIENLRKLAKLEASIIAEHYGYTKEAVGDIDGDGKVNAKDYTMLKRHVENTLTSEQLDRADVNKDGKVDAKDYEAIKKSILN